MHEEPRKKHFTPPLKNVKFCIFTKISIRTASLYCITDGLSCDERLTKQASTSWQLQAELR